MAFIAQLSNIKIDTDGQLIYSADASVADSVIAHFNIVRRHGSKAVFVCEHSKGWFGFNTNWNPISLRGKRLAHNLFVFYKYRAELDAFMATLPPSLLN